MEAARPLPQNYVRCNQKTDLSVTGNCKGGQTFCEELPTGWYKCTNKVTGRVTWERYVDGKKVTRTTPPPAGTTPTTAATTPADDTPAADPTGPPTTEPTADPTTKPTIEPTEKPTTKLTADPQPGGSAVSQAIAAARTAGLRTWVETDLADDFRAGDAQFQAAVNGLVAQARKTGVIGVKFANHLGLTGFGSASEVKRFVTAATTALRAKLPGKRLAMGVIVPELGCGSATDCVADMRNRYPTVTKSKVDDYVRSSGVDRVYVATGLYGKAYSAYKITVGGKATPLTGPLAIQVQWMSVRALGWDAIVQVGSREFGLTHEGDGSPWDAARAKAEVEARVGNAIALGAQTVTLWTHRGTTDNALRRVLNAGLAGNEVWKALGATGMRDRLSIVFDPADPEVSVGQDVAALAKGVGEIFVQY